MASFEKRGALALVTDDEQFELVTRGHCTHFWLENTYVDKDNIIKVWTVKDRQEAFRKLFTVGCGGADCPSFDELAKDWPFINWNTVLNELLTIEYLGELIEFEIRRKYRVIPPRISHIVGPIDKSVLTWTQSIRRTVQRRIDAYRLSCARVRSVPVHEHDRLRCEGIGERGVKILNPQIIIRAVPREVYRCVNNTSVERTLRQVTVKSVSIQFAAHNPIPRLGQYAPRFRPRDRPRG